MSGTYTRQLRLSSGRYAMIEGIDPDGGRIFQLVPWSRENRAPPRPAHHRHSRAAGGGIDWTLGRKARARHLIKGPRLRPPPKHLLGPDHLPSFLAPQNTLGGARIVGPPGWGFYLSCRPVGLRGPPPPPLSRRPPSSGGWYFYDAYARTVFWEGGAIAASGGFISIRCGHQPCPSSGRVRPPMSIPMVRPVGRSGPRWKQPGCWVPMAFVLGKLDQDYLTP